MTSPTPAARRTTDRLAVALALLLISGCGAASRRAMLGSQVRASEGRPEAVRRVLGTEPMASELWVWWARNQGSAEEALAVVEQGRRFQPSDPQLALAEVTLLATLDRRAEQVQVAQRALAGGRVGPAAVDLQWLVVDGLLAMDDADQARNETLRLGGVSGVTPEMLGVAWARVAFALGREGRADEADVALRRSLDLGVAGLSALRQESRRDLDTASTLVRRAAGRDPGHPDLALYLAVDQIVTGRLDEAARLLADLPDPLPARMAPEVQLVQARLDLMQGRSEPALAVVRARLDADPGDDGAVALLLESWQRNGQPGEDELRSRLAAARAEVRDPMLAQAIQTVLQQLGSGDG
jgi:Flp pilus assembly protein TadD